MGSADVGAAAENEQPVPAWAAGETEEVKAVSELGFFLAGMTTAVILAWMAARREWHNRRKLERRVNDLWKHLSCGEGHLGCDGGPECPWDHK